MLLRAFCGFDEKPVIMVIGGSTGAAVINARIRGVLPELLKNYNVVHLCGKGKMDATISSPGYVQYEYISEELPDLFALADVVISRAGANSICEILALNKPNILVPLSAKASRGDQILNASSFESQGYSYVLEEENMTNLNLLTAIDYVVTNKQRYIDAMKASNQMDSVKKVIGLIEELSK